MALPNLSALVPPTGVDDGPSNAGSRFTNRVVVEEPEQNRDVDNKCQFQVCTDKNKLPFNVRSKDLLYGEEVLVRYETPLPDNFNAEMINDYSGAAEEQWQHIVYHQILKDDIQSEMKTEHRHGVFFREKLAKQGTMFVDGTLVVTWTGSKPRRMHLDETLWLEDKPKTCTDPDVQPRLCFISMQAWAAKLAAMNGKERGEHREKTLFDGYCHALHGAFRLHDRRETTGVANMSAWIDDANFAAILVQMYQIVLRGLVRAGRTKPLSDREADEEVHERAKCSAAFNTKSSRAEQVADIYQLIVDLKRRALEMSRERGALAGHKQPPRDPEDLPSREELEAEAMAEWNKRRNCVDYSN